MPDGNEYKQVSFNIEEGLLEKVKLCMAAEHVHSQSEAFRLAIREWVNKTIERNEIEDLMKKNQKLTEENEFYKKMYLSERHVNGAIKKKFQKEIKKDIEKENNSIEDNLFK